MISWPVKTYLTLITTLINMREQIKISWKSLSEHRALIILLKKHTRIQAPKPILDSLIQTLK